MIDLSVVQILDGDFRWRFDLHLYDDIKFQEINNDLPQASFFLVNKVQREVYGHLRVALIEGKAISHVSAPFGGFDFAEETKFEDQLFFVIEVQRLLKEIGVKDLLIHQPPASSDSNAEFSSRLRYLGFEIKEERAYQMIPIQESFEKGLHQMEKRKLLKAEENGFSFDWAPSTKLKEVLDFVEEQRSLLGYEFSMNWNQLRAYHQAFPTHYLGARVWHDGRMIAASILVKEKENTLYQFAPAHLRAYNRYSPVVFMTANIVEWAKSRGFSWLNLGTSYVDGVKNESLYQFKENLGAHTFIAASFQKSLNS